MHIIILSGKKHRRFSPESIIISISARSNRTLRNLERKSPEGYSFGRSVKIVE
jgi:hypothetical protein